MKPVARVFFLGYFLCVIADVYLIALHHGDLRIFTKPLLMPLLALAYFSEIRPLNKFSRLIILALLFSWAGDLLLMFTNKGEWFFVTGLVCFLGTHLYYIRYFLKISAAKPSFFRKRPVLFLAVLAYVVELLFVLWPQLGGMKIPVTLYSIAISAMLIAALWQYGKLENKTAFLFISGALFFVASDSMLAVEKFKTSFNHAGPLIMITYAMAQWLIVRGSVSHLKALSTGDKPLPDAGIPVTMIS